MEQVQNIAGAVSAFAFGYEVGGVWLGEVGGILLGLLAVGAQQIVKKAAVVLLPKKRLRPNVISEMTLKV